MATSLRRYFLVCWRRQTRPPMTSGTFLALTRGRHSPVGEGSFFFACVLPYSRNEMLWGQKETRGVEDTRLAASITRSV